MHRQIAVNFFTVSQVFDQQMWLLFLNIWVTLTPLTSSWYYWGKYLKHVFKNKLGNYVIFNKSMLLEYKNFTFLKSYIGQNINNLLLSVNHRSSMTNGKQNTVPGKTAVLQYHGENMQIFMTL
jgi:hypothetical protein